MCPEDGREVGVIHLILSRRAYREHIKDLRGVVASELPVEAVGAVYGTREVAHTGELLGVAGVPSKNEDLEAGVCGKEVLDLERASIGCAHENVGQHALADDEVGGVCLVCGVDDRRGGVVDANARSESSEGLEGSIGVIGAGHQVYGKDTRLT